ncbi:WD40/YVTN/BNR-like repeat-containing protein [Nocardioides speluncae]|uniref:WD40/YVTN/BNR-like repeat-containing protein n=1 Tax=Nocardioides speluncae TaxID=2670337 RepID=UPI0012B16AAB|nr:oxidoreductase [Nocardioides speluncae]
MRTLLGVLVAALALSLLPATASAGGHGLAREWDRVDVGSDESLRGLAAVDRRTAWVSGSNGGVWKTTNSGRTWTDVRPPDTAGLLFRDVEAWDAKRAQVLAIGEGEASRIYRTVDGGRTWTETFRSAEPTAFYDCMAFFPGGKHGLAMSDPVDGKFRIIETHDFGRSWQIVPNDGMPAAVAGEFAFAASGTCLVTAGSRDAWLASGGGASRIFHSRDRGHTWTVVNAPIPATPAGGVFSLAFRNPRKGVAVGGDFEAPDNGVDASGWTRDGMGWHGGGDLSGYRSGVSWVYEARSTLVAVGPTGTDVTRDGGRTWTALNDTGFHAVQCVPRACWASGAAGAVGLLD